MLANMESRRLHLFLEEFLPPPVTFPVLNCGKLDRPYVKMINILEPDKQQLSP